MSVIDRVRAKAEARISGRVESVVTSVTAPVNEAVNRVRAVKGQIEQAISDVNRVGSSIRALARVGQGGTPVQASVRANAQRLGQQLRLQRTGQSAVVAPPGLQRASAPTAASTTAVPSALKVARAPMWGGMTLDEYIASFTASSLIARSWKNLFFVSIAELTQTPQSPAAAGLINLLAVDVSYAPYTMPGDAVQIGGGNMDSLATTDRVELRLTTFDDEVGTLKRWFYSKASQAAHKDGTFGMPVDYLMYVTVIHMDPTGRKSPGQRLREQFLMRASNIEIELSRRAPELQELSLSFVEFDTFYAKE